jgi:uncharacterized Fe-S cluster protein YjdI
MCSYFDALLTGQAQLLFSSSSKCTVRKHGGVRTDFLIVICTFSTHCLQGQAQLLFSSNSKCMVRDERGPEGGEFTTVVSVINWCFGACKVGAPSPSMPCRKSAHNHSWFLHLCVGVVMSVAYS